jgi:hypothetical protein
VTRRILAAATVPLHVLVIVAGLSSGAAATAAAALLAWRWRNQKISAARTTPRFSRRWCEPLRRSRRRGAHPPYPSESAGELPGGLHLHFHGVSVEDIAAMLARQTPPGPDVNRPGQQPPAPGATPRWSPKTVPATLADYEVYRFGGHELANRQQAARLLDGLFAPARSRPLLHPSSSAAEMAGQTN